MSIIRLKKGFSLVETIVSLLLISIVFSTIATGVGSILQSISILSNQQRKIELENFIARYVYMQGTLGNVQIDISKINQAFYKGSQVSYPRTTDVQSQSVGQYFIRHTFTIEMAPGRTERFYVYQYKAY